MKITELNHNKTFLDNKTCNFADQKVVFGTKKAFFKLRFLMKLSFCELLDLRYFRKKIDQHYCDGLFYYVLAFR